MFYVYCIFNTINGKLYIGKTNDLHRRWLEHQRIARGGKQLYDEYSVVHVAINKYGLDSFEFYEVQSFMSEEQAYEAEEYWIQFYKSRKPKFGYNATDGGIGVGSGPNSANFGLKRSEETLEKMRESHLGEKNSNYGKTFSVERLQNMSKAQKGKRCGEEQSNVILSWEKVDKIRELYSKGMGPTELSKMFGTHRANIYSIINYKTWIK